MGFNIFNISLAQGFCPVHIASIADGDIPKAWWYLGFLFSF
jgi:hypothetical protein